MIIFIYAYKYVIMCIYCISHALSYSEGGFNLICNILITFKSNIHVLFI